MMRRHHLLALLPLLSLSLAPVSEARGDTSYALVIGVNEPLGKNTRPLAYADDDAILFHRLFAGLGHSTVLVSPDAATGRLHGEIPGARRPTRANVKRAIDEVLGRVKRARESGWRPHLYLVYSGHGDVKNNRGYLALADGRFTARDLAELVLARSRALTNHVIVDACRSYYLVHEKRAGGKRRRVGGRFHSSRDLTRRFPNTGFLLSTSSAASSHEWAEYQAGIFSHEVRSGLLGGADVDLDGRVTYNELWAFIRVANIRIPNERFRPRIFVKAPYRQGKRPILDLRGFTGAAVTIPRQRAGRYMLEDRNGVRLADLHSSSSQQVRLRLTDGRILGRPSDRLYLHDLKRSTEYLLDTGWKQRRQLALLPGLPSSYRPKGAANDAFARIFERPFSLDAYHLELQCTMQREHEAACPSYYCDRCRCEGCRHGGAAEAPASLAEPVVRRRRSRFGERDPWETVIELSAGFELLTRSFESELAPGPYPGVHYYSDVAGAITLDAEFYPLAVWNLPILANLGLTFRYLHVLGLKTTIRSAEGPGEVGTRMSQWDFGFVGRWNLFSRATSPTLKAGIEIGELGFSLDGNPSEVDLPAVKYVYMRLRFFQLDVPLLRRGSSTLGLYGGFSYLVVYTAGQLEDAPGYGGAHADGIEIDLGARYAYGHFTLTAGFSYQRFFFSFDDPASDAADAYAGGSLLGGFRF